MQNTTISDMNETMDNSALLNNSIIQSKMVPTSNHIQDMKQATTDSRQTKQETTNKDQHKEESKEGSNLKNSTMLARLGEVSMKDRIMIHVIDDNKNQKRDFQFSRSLLVKYMKYFDKCLKKISENDEIDISIHCDAGIFEWLLCYILAYDDTEVHKHPSKSWSLKV